MEANRRTSCSTKSAATDEMSIKNPLLVTYCAHEKNPHICHFLWFINKVQNNQIKAKIKILCLINF